MQIRDGKYPYNDYSGKMPHLTFKYDENFYTDDLPDPQVNPVLPGARVPLRKVGIAPVDLPIQVQRRDGTTQVLQSEASLYCSLDDPNAKGLNLSRLYLLMHEKIKDHLTLTGIRDTLKELAEKQGSKNAYCKLRFKYPMTQEALRSRCDHDHDKKLEGHIAYKTELEGRYHDGEYRFFLTVDYVYSSTCPCSFELAQDAMEKRDAAANAHSQRSIMKVTVEFKPETIIWIEDLVELCRTNIPTEVQIVVKRRDEQAFAELNGSNLLFSEDVCRIMYRGLDEWYKAGRITDFSIAVSHEESLHPWNAIAVTSKFDPLAESGVLA
jgi:GTP cyclohydrolase I